MFIHLIYHQNHFAVNISINPSKIILILIIFWNDSRKAVILADNNALTGITPTTNIIKPKNRLKFIYNIIPSTPLRPAKRRGASFHLRGGDSLSNKKPPLRAVLLPPFIKDPLRRIKARGWGGFQKDALIFFLFLLFKI